MARAQSVILTPADKKVAKKELAEKLKAAKADVKTNEAALKAAEKAKNDAIKLAESTFKAVAKDVGKTLANAQKVLAEVEKHSAALA